MKPFIRKNISGCCQLLGNCIFKKIANAPFSRMKIRVFAPFSRMKISIFAPFSRSYALAATAIIW